MPRLYCLALSAIVLAGALSVLPPAAIAAPGAATSTPCQAPIHRQFDFWLGDWDTYDSDALDKPPVARTHIEAILGNCVLREIHDQTDGLVGQSFTIYDASRKIWHQSWVTNHGQLLILEGHMQGNRMVLSGIDHAHNDTLIRVSWEPQANGVHEIASKSSDGGKHWQPLFDIQFRAHRSGSK